MSGTAHIKQPRSNEEWARGTQQRLDQSEHSTSARVGAWVFSTDPNTGALIASHKGGGSILIASVPAAGTDPDVVITSSIPYIKVARQSQQSGNRGSTYTVAWDTVDQQTDQWSFVPTASDITITEDGLYEIEYNLYYSETSVELVRGTVLLDGVVRMKKEYIPAGEYPMLDMSEKFNLSTGTVVTARVYKSGVGPFFWGPTGVDANVYSSLSITKIEV